MRKNILLLLSAILLATPAVAQDGPKRVVEAPPAANMDNIYRVGADRTPSGFVVPRFVSLKFSKVNGRTGPSREHPIACLLYTSPSPRDQRGSRMPSSA